MIYLDDFDAEHLGKKCGPAKPAPAPTPRRIRAVRRSTISEQLRQAVRAVKNAKTDAIAAKWLKRIKELEAQEEHR